MIPFVIDNDQHRLSDVLNALLVESSGRPLDVATAYFSVSGYRRQSAFPGGSGTASPSRAPWSPVDS